MKRETVKTLKEKFPIKRIRCTKKEAMAAYKRVLKLVDGYLKFEPQETLITDGRGLMTYGEIRYHIKSALALRPNEL